MEGEKTLSRFFTRFRNLVRKKGSYLMLATLVSSERVFRDANKNHLEFRQPKKTGVVVVLFCGMNFPKLDFSDL